MSKKLIRNAIRNIVSKNKDRNNEEVVPMERVYEVKKSNKDTVYIKANVKKGMGTFGKIMEQFYDDENVKVVACSARPLEAEDKSDEINILLKISQDEACFGRLISTLDKDEGVTNLQSQLVSEDMSARLESKMHKNIDSFGNYY